jgi:hypothetical protein
VVTRRDLLRAIFGATAAVAARPVVNAAQSISNAFNTSNIAQPKIDVLHRMFSLSFSSNDLISQRTLSLTLPAQFNIFSIGIRLDQSPISAAESLLENAWIKLMFGQDPFLYTGLANFHNGISALIPSQEPINISPAMAKRIGYHVPSQRQNLQVVIDSETVWTPPPGIIGQIIVQDILNK